MCNFCICYNTFLYNFFSKNVNKLQTTELKKSETNNVKMYLGKIVTTFRNKNANGWQNRNVTLFNNNSVTMFRIKNVTKNIVEVLLGSPFSKFNGFNGFLTVFSTSERTKTSTCTFLSEQSRGLDWSKSTTKSSNRWH